MHDLNRQVCRAARGVAAACAIAALAGCAGQPSAEDYARYESALVALGDLRTETAPADAPYDNDDLARNFSRIALRHEVDIERAGAESNSARNPLQRWEGPIRYRAYGRGVDPADEEELAEFFDRIEALTGREVIEVDEGVNMMVLITEPAERVEVAKALRALNPALARGFDLWRTSPHVVCTATNLVSERDRHAIIFGMVLIGSEVTGLLRRSCLHEEIAQSLGLGNDHPEVRPSIFNDDEEFALLTEHDEWLIRVLYDDRLHPGMTEEEALPVVRDILAEIRPESGA